MNDGDGRDIPLKGEMSAQAGRELDTKGLDLRAILDPRDLRVGADKLFLETTQQTRMAISISDPHEEDCPIVYCNQAFIDLTGYSREEILGRNCRFLQGRSTDREAVAKLREGIAQERYTVVDLLNYRKDGAAFWNAVHVGPIYDEHGKLQYFYGSQWDITELLSERQKSVTQQLIARELQHRTDNIFAVMNAIVGLTARRERDVESYADKLSERIRALAAAHRVTIPSDPDRQSADLGELVDEVMKPYRNRFEDRVLAKGPEVELEPRVVTALGLALHELATNAIKYGALSVAAGQVAIMWRQDNQALVLEWKEQGGPSAEGEADISGGTGTLLIEGMLASLNGTVERDYAQSGLTVTITVPPKVEGAH